MRESVKTLYYCELIPTGNNKIQFYVLGLEFLFEKRHDPLGVMCGYNIIRVMIREWNSAGFLDLTLFLYLPHVLSLCTS